VYSFQSLAQYEKPLVPNHQNLLLGSGILDAQLMLSDIVRRL